jgi:glycosyltransferase involved in cell wall biosynthesis
MEKVCVVMPARNESGNVADLIRRVRTQGLGLILIDDGSQDNTSETAMKAGAVVLRNEKNLGKGSSLINGFRLAITEGYKAVVTMDADGQHLPEDIPKLINKAKDSHADIVVGNRMFDPKGMPQTRIATNKLMSWLISKIAQVRIPDTQCGFRFIRSSVLEKIKLNTRRYETESELLIKAARRGFKIESAPVRSIYRKERSRINPLVDTFRFIRFIIGELWITHN